MPGPPPKRSSQRRRRNETPGGIDSAAGAENVEIPEPGRGWHRIARAWYLALADSGQARYYEPSDWSTAFLIAELMSRELKPQAVGAVVLTRPDGTEVAKVVRAAVPVRAASLSSWLRAMTALMVTEGDRRRLRLELERPEEPRDPDVADMDTYRNRLTSG